ncbi:MAG: sugar porter family MFS transporter [Puniceicoccales bacterium]|nr:sugar porter family MFS transporter [Puniceicoccales bacterium]
MSTPTASSPKAYNIYLLVIAGLGGLLYGIDVGIIAGALPYLEATSGYSDGQLSSVVAAVLAGSVLSSLFAGLLSDLFGRKTIMLVSAFLFIASIPVICLSDSFAMLVAGRLLQGVSAGLIGVVIPLYLAECLGANSRGKGTGMFQFLLTVGLVAAAFIGLYFAKHVEAIESIVNVTKDTIFAAKNSAWRSIFWVSVIPGLVFFLGAFFVSESPRWLFRKGRKEAARAALARANGQEEGDAILAEMERNSTKKEDKSDAAASSGSLLQRKYVIPFILAIVILACTQATGINSVLAYSVKIFQQAGLTGAFGNYGDVLLKIVNCLMTVVAVVLVDKKGRKFLLKMGTSGIIFGLICAALLFKGIESKRTDVTEKVQIDSIFKVSEGRYVADLRDDATLQSLGLTKDSPEMQFIVTYKLGENGGTELTNSKTQTREQEVDGKTVIKTIDPIIAIDLPKIKDGDAKPVLEVLKAEIGPMPSKTTGWFVAVSFIIFIAAYASGPGVCVWLALSELMPTRIRSNGMSIALLINQGVSTTIAAIFLPTVGSFGYSTMFFFWAGCTVVYFITAAFFLPETKGRTLEEIEEHFEGKKKLS